VCVRMRAHARVCVRMCFVLQVLGQVLHGAGAHVCRAPGAVQECRAPGAGAHVCRAAGAGAAAGQVLEQVLGLVLQELGLGLGLGLGQGLLRSSLFNPPTKI